MKSEPATRRAVRTADLESHYAQLLASHATSGVSLREFAQRHGISAWTLYGWRRRLSAKASAAPALEPQLVAVEVVGLEQRPREFVYEIVLQGGTCLRVPRDFEAARVAELVALVRAC